MGDIIKNKIAVGNYDISLGRKLGRILHPILQKKLFPNLYKYEINGTNSEKAARDLLDMIASIQKDVIPRDIIDFQKGLPKEAEYAASRSNVEDLVKTHNNIVVDTFDKTFERNSTGDKVDVLKSVFAEQIKPMVEKLTIKLWNPITESNKKGLTKEDALINSRLARILTVDDYDFTKKEPILWSPAADYKINGGAGSKDEAT